MAKAGNSKNWVTDWTNRRTSPWSHPKEKRCLPKKRCWRTRRSWTRWDPPVQPHPPRRWPRCCRPCDRHLPLIAHRLIFPPPLRNCWSRCPSVRKGRPWKRCKKRKKTTRWAGIFHPHHPTGTTPRLRRGCPMPCYLDEIPSTSMTTTNKRFPHRTSVPFTNCLYPITSLNKVGLMSNVPYNCVRSSWTKRRHPSSWINCDNRSIPNWWLAGAPPTIPNRHSCVFVMNLWPCVFPGPPRTWDVCF